MMKFSLFLSPLHTLRGWFHSIDIAVFQFSHQVSTSDWTCVAWWHWGSTTHLHWLQPLLLVPHYQHCRQPAWCLCWLYYCGQLGETGQTEHSLLLPDSFAGPDNTLGRASPLRTTCRAGTGPCLPPSSLAGTEGGQRESYNGMFLLQAAGDCRRTACNAAELSPPAAASCRRTAVKARQGLSLLQSVRLPGALIFLLGTGNTSLSLPLSLSLLTLYSLLSLSYYQYNTKSSIPKYFLHAVLCLYCVGSMM